MKQCHYSRYAIVSIFENQAHIMKALYASALALCSIIVNAQTLPYKLTAQIDSAVQYDTIPWRHQAAAWDYAYIGEYQLALKAWDAPYQSKRKPRSKETIETYLAEPKAILKAYRPAPAISYILEAAKQTRLVIVNEAHHNPMHRAYMESLLPGLYAQGYTYIGMEGVDYVDSLLNQRKYPVIATGYYVKEPAFGNMIRTALRIGYTVFPYESTSDRNAMEREINQANNIKLQLDQHPQSKFIIYCGFDHAIEDSTRNAWVMAMAGRLKTLTGIDPLTIDQVALTETSDPHYDNFYRQALHLDYSAVLVDSSGRAFNTAALGKSFDVNVYHPTTRFIYKRPHWLLGKNKKLVSVNKKINIDYPCLLLAYNAKEDIDTAIPVDIIELASKEDDKRLILKKKKKYVIVALNGKQQKQVLTIH